MSERSLVLGGLRTRTGATTVTTHTLWRDGLYLAAVLMLGAQTLELVGVLTRLPSRVTGWELWPVCTAAAALVALLGHRPRWALVFFAGSLFPFGSFTTYLLPLLLALGVLALRPRPAQPAARPAAALGVAALAIGAAFGTTVAVVGVAPSRPVFPALMAVPAVLAVIGSIVDARLAVAAGIALTAVVVEVTPGRLDPVSVEAALTLAVLGAGWLTAVTLLASGWAVAHRRARI